MLALALTLCLVAPQTETFFVGDSVGTHLRLSIDHVDSVSGRRIEQATLPPLEAGDTLVIELGNNNMDDPESWPLLLDLADSVPPDVCLFIVTPYNGWFPDFNESFASMVRAHTEANPRPCGGIIPWHALARVDLTVDFTHPTELGAWYLSALIDQTINPNGQPLG